MEASQAALTIALLTVSALCAAVAFIAMIAMWVFTSIGPEIWRFRSMFVSALFLFLAVIFVILAERQ